MDIIGILVLVISFFFLLVVGVPVAYSIGVFYGSFYHGRSAGKCQVYVGTVRGNGSIAAVCYHIGGEYHE